MARLRPLRSTLALIIVAVVGLGASAPASGATKVPRARLADRAKNANSVDGLSASRRPRPGRLLALNRAGRFPASVFSSSLSPVFQRRLARACPNGQAIQSVAEDGGVTCQPTGDVTSVEAGAGLVGGGTSGAIELAVAPPLDLGLGTADPLLRLLNSGTGSALVAGSSSPLSTGYFSNAAAGDALQANASASSSGNALSAYQRGLGGYALEAEQLNPDNPGTTIFARTAGTADTASAIDAEVNATASKADALFARTTSTDPDSHAGVFSGNVLISGNLTVTGTITNPIGGFRAGALAGSARRSVDGGAQRSVLDGMVRTDSRGYASVRVPRRFGALEGGFRYQLTTIRSFARAIVWRELRGSRFVIRTRRPRVKVSWQVTGIRGSANEPPERVR